MQNRRVGVRAVIWNEDGLFLALNNREEGDGQNDFWSIPGGGLDMGESLQDGLRREIVEELGVEPEIGDLLFIQQFVSPRDDCQEELEFFFHVKNSKDFEEIDLSKTKLGQKEIHDFGFFDPQSRRVLPLLLQQVDIEKAIKSGKTQIFSYLEP